LHHQINNQMQEQIILSSINKEQLAEEIADKVISRIGATKPQKEEKLEYLSRAEVAGILHISLPKLNELTKQGHLISYKFGNRVLYEKESISAFIESNKVNYLPK